MKVKERAQADLQDAILEVDNSSKPMDNWQRNEKIMVAMNRKGWHVTVATLPDTAKSLGFPVVGMTIYGLDD